MGLLGFGRALTAPAAEALAPGRRARLASPWSPGLSTSIMAADWLGAVDLPVTRDQAMKVPAVVAARNLLCENFAQGVWRRYRKAAELTPPVWAYRTDGELSPYLRSLWTFDDVLFTGFGLWRAYRTRAGELGDAVRVPPEMWDWDEDWNILLDGEPAKREDVILFPGWDEGLLITGNTTIRAALDLAAEVQRRVRVPQAHTVLTQTQELELDLDEKRAVIDDFVAARRSPNGAVSLLPHGIGMEKGGEAPVSLYENGRNASTLDVARLTGVPATLLEASQTNASLTYETREGTRSLLHERVRARAAVFEGRLSMDDVTPRGTRMGLDLSHLQPDNTGTAPVTED